MVAFNSNISSEFVVYILQPTLNHFSLCSLANAIFYKILMAIDNGILHSGLINF